LRSARASRWLEPCTVMPAAASDVATINAADTRFISISPCPCRSPRRHFVNLETHFPLRWPRLRFRGEFLEQEKLRARSRLEHYSTVCRALTSPLRRSTCCNTVSTDGERVWMCRSHGTLSSPSLSSMDVPHGSVMKAMNMSLLGICRYVTSRVIPSAWSLLQNASRLSTSNPM
jgi:hypothetical protein